MTCPLEVADALLDLIDLGITESRRAAEANDPTWSAREADHLYRLTHLLHDYSDDLLRFYWAVERVAYLRQLDGYRSIAWQLLWERLRPLVHARFDSVESLYASYELGVAD